MNIEGNDQFNIKVLLLLVFFFFIRLDTKGLQINYTGKHKRNIQQKKKKTIFSQVV